MENIWNEAQEKVYNGSTFRINLEKRDLVIDGKYIIKDSKYEGELGYDTKFPVNALLVMVEEYYREYLHSVPSARSEASIGVISVLCRSMNFLRKICYTVSTGI